MLNGRRIVTKRLGDKIPMPLLSEQMTNTVGKCLGDNAKVNTFSKHRAHRVDNPVSTQDPTLFKGFGSCTRFFNVHFN